MIGVYYFYKKIDRRKKVNINQLISERDGLGNFLDKNELNDINEKLEFKIPNTLNDVLDKYNFIKDIKKELKGEKVTLCDICYFVIDLDLGEKRVKEELDKIRKSEGFIRFLTKEDIEKEKCEHD